MYSNLEFRSVKHTDLPKLKLWASVDDIRFSHYTFTDYNDEMLLEWYHTKQKFITRKLYGLFDINGTYNTKCTSDYPIGLITLKHINLINSSAELGIFIDPAFQNKGFGSELLKRFTYYVYQKFPINILRLRVAVWNTRAIYAYLKAGFTFEISDSGSIIAYTAPYECQLYIDEISTRYPELFYINLKGVVPELMTDFYTMVHHKNSKTIKSYAKINLSLNVIGLLDNGYHSLDMLMQEISLYDIVTVVPRNDKELCLYTKKEISNENNLAFKAAKLMMKLYDLNGFDIYIRKRIPMEAGLGGGSSNAAAVLRAINELLELKLPNSKLEEIAVTLGADVPFFINGGLQIARGIGEKLTSLTQTETNTLDYHILLCKPAKGLSTKAVFAEYDKSGQGLEIDTDILGKAYLENNITEINKYTQNALEQVIINIAPDLDKEIKNIKSTLMTHGALAAAMTGSGSTVFGIFKSAEQIDRIYDILKNDYNVYKSKCIMEEK